MAETIAEVSEPRKYADWSPPRIVVTRDQDNDELTITATPLLADRRMFDASSVSIHSHKLDLIEFAANLVAHFTPQERVILYDRVVDLDCAQPGA